MTNRYLNTFHGRIVSVKALLARTWAVLLFSISLLPLSGHAQLAGHNTLGDYGLQSGTQAPPGFYMVPMYYDYTADTLRNADGDRLPTSGNGGSLDANAGILGLLWVGEKKILGGNYGFGIWPAVTNNGLEAPALGLDTKTSTGLADLYIQPVILGWSKQAADFTAGIGIYAPTGDYEAGGDNNRGLGMWSLELFGGATVYFDEARTWHAAATAFYETHGKKEDSDIRVGDILTIEGGLGKSFMDGAMNVGLAYYAQWKISNDDFGAVPPGGRILGKHRVYAFGPEVTLPIASKQTLFGFLNLRYFWETGARTKLEGNTFVATFTFPVPSIPLQ